MESRARFAGHAVHPMLVVFPLGLLGTSLVFDLLDVVSGDRRYGVAAFFLIGAGLVGGVVAALFGLIDWLAIPKGTRARRVGLLHAIGNEVFLLLFAVAWLLRLDRVDHHVTTLALVLAVAGIVVSCGTGWLGGELVQRLGVSVTPGAHLDAPSSLRTPTVIDLRESSGRTGATGQAPERSARH